MSHKRQEFVFKQDESLSNSENRVTEGDFLKISKL